MKKLISGFILLSLLILSFPFPSYGGSRVYVGVNIGVRHPYVVVHRPFWGPPRVYRYWGGPAVLVPFFYYYGPAPVIIREDPLANTQADQLQENYWYYCPDTQSYYPYVKSCPSGWMKVVPQVVPPDVNPTP